MRLHHIALRARALATTARFYEEVFGLAAIRTQGEYSVWLASGEVVVMIEQRTEAEPLVAEGSLDLLAWCVTPEEKAAVRARLDAWGSRVEHETAHTIYFRDPDGRRVGVSSYPLPSTPIHEGTT